MERGRFITLEGGEGTGKSTLIAGLTTALRDRGISVIVTREPGGTPLAEKIRELALNPPEDHEWSPLAHALLMNAAREDHQTSHLYTWRRNEHSPECPLPSTVAGADILLQLDGLATTTATRPTPALGFQLATQLPTDELPPLGRQQGMP